MKGQDQFIVVVRWLGIVAVAYIVCMTVLEILEKL